MIADLKKISQKIKDRLSHHHISSFEIYVEAKQGTNLEIKNGKRDLYEIKMGLGFGLRILKDHRMCFSYGFDLSDSAIDQVVQKCIDSLPYQKTDKNYTFAKPTQMKDELCIADPNFFKYSYDDKFNFLVSMEKTAKTQNKKISNVIFTALDDEHETIFIENSNGVALGQEKTAFCASLGVQADISDSQEVAYQMESKINFKELDYKSLAKLATNHAVDLLSGHPIKSYKGPIILSNEVVSEFLNILSHSFLGDSIYNNNSYLCKKLGQHVYSSQITIIDDGHNAEGMGSGVFDGEGSPIQKTVIVQNGQLNHFLYDLYWGQKSGEKTTGNSCRDDLTTVPNLSYHNLFIAKGSNTLDGMFKVMDEGLYITDIIGIHNSDEISGRFSVGVQGQYVKDGQKQSAIRSMIFSGNLHQMLNHVISVGNDLKFFGELGAPSMLIEQAELTGV